MHAPLKDYVDIDDVRLRLGEAQPAAGDWIGQHEILNQWSEAYAEQGFLLK